MNFPTAQARHDNRVDVMTEIHDRLERRENAIRTRIEGDSEKLADAVSDYFDPLRVEMDGHDLLTDMTLALAASERWLQCICDGESVPDAELSAFRSLLRTADEAKRRQAAAIADAVETELLR